MEKKASGQLTKRRRRRNGWALTNEMRKGHMSLRNSFFFLFSASSDDEGEELFYKRGTEFKLPYPCLYDFDTNFSSNCSDEENYSLKHHSTLMKTNGATNSNLLTNSTTSTSTLNNTNSSSRPKKIAKTSMKQPSISHFSSTNPNTNSGTSSFDPYYNAYPSSYVSSYPSDVTAASFLEAAATTTTTNYSSNSNNPNDLLLVNETHPYGGTYSNYYAAALQQQYQNSLAPYHAAVYYPDATNRYYPNHRTSPNIPETTYHSHHHQSTTNQGQSPHENYMIENNPTNNSYSYYLYNKTPSVTSHGHDSNNNLSLFDVSLSAPIHHSVIKHCTKR